MLTYGVKSKAVSQVWHVGTYFSFLFSIYSERTGQESRGKLYDDFFCRSSVELLHILTGLAGHFPSCPRLLASLENWIALEVSHRVKNSSLSHEDVLDILEWTSTHPESKVRPCIFFPPLNILCSCT